MKDIRCNRCSKLLAKALFKQIEIKCSRCKTINFLKAIEPLTQHLECHVNEVNNGQANSPLDGGVKPV